MGPILGPDRCWTGQAGERDMASMAAFERSVTVHAAAADLAGTLTRPNRCRGLVIFAHGSGSSRFSSRNRFVADRLVEAGPSSRFALQPVRFRCGLPRSRCRAQQRASVASIPAPPAPALHVDQQSEHRQGCHQRDLIASGLWHQDVGDQMGHVGD